MVYEASALRKRTMEEASSTSALLEYMGFHGENQDPSTAEANWRHVERRLNTHPHEARALWGISYPLNLALSNSTTPVPACVVKLMIGCYPEACNDEDFGNACRYAHTTGDVLRVLLDAKPGIPSKEFIKRWDLDWIACNNNRDVAKVLILNCEAAKPSCIKEWKEMRPSSHTFWFELLMENKATAVSLQNIKSKRLLMFFILQGNYTNVKLILDTYPELIAVTSYRGNTSKQLPIHTALANSDSTGYRPWHNRSPIVRFLLDLGFEHNVGGDDACGGLYTFDSSSSALNHAIDSALNCPWDDPERKRCLQICLQFAQARMYNKSPHEIDPNVPILHASIGVVQINTFSAILEKYKGCTLHKDNIGRTAIFELVSTVTRRPTNGYTATSEIMRSMKQERDLEDGNDRRNVAFARGARLNNENVENRMLRNLVQPQGRHVLERMAGRLWDRERSILADDPDHNHDVLFIEGTRRLRALQGLLDLVESRRNRNNDDGGDNDANANEAAQRPAEGPNVIMHMNGSNQGHLLDNVNGPNAARVEIARRLRRQMRRQRFGNEPDELFPMHPALNIRRERLLRPQINELQEGNDFEPEIDLETITPLRNLIDERNRELDDIQEKIVEKKYFGSIRKILLNDVLSTGDELKNCAKMKDSLGMLPLHFAAERGMTVEQGFKDIVHAYPEGVSDDVDGFFPFMYAASANASPNLIFQLLRECPEVGLLTRK